MTKISISNSDVRYFFDTYGLIELLKKNLNYAKFKGIRFVTGSLNYAEVVYWMIRNRRHSKKILEAIRKTIISFETGDLDQAMRFRYRNKVRNVSLVDCVGYAMALRRKLVFVTGDEGFRDLDNIEFVK